MQNQSGGSVTAATPQQKGLTMDKKKAAHVQAAMKYNTKNVKQIKLNLNRKTDADIIKQLEQTDNVQGYIKDLIRKDMNEKGRQ